MRSQEKIENSFAEMKAELKALNSRKNNAEEWISNLEGRKTEITQLGQQTENQMKKHETNKRDIWDDIKQDNIQIIGITGEEINKVKENIYEEIKNWCQQ